MTAQPSATPRYVLFGSNSGTYCRLKFLEDFEDTHKLYKGWPLTGEWPRNALFRMDPDFKKRIMLSDHLLNLNRVIVASKRLQEFFLAEKVPNIELLPVTIYDHKKRIASKEYAIIHLVTTQDCIDVKASGVSWNQINPEDIRTMERMVIDESKVDESAVVFRAKGLGNHIFLTREFSVKLANTGFSGIRFWELSDYRG
jgi:hypothetical protein